LRASWHLPAAGFFTKFRLTASAAAPNFRRLASFGETFSAPGSSRRARKVRRPGPPCPSLFPLGVSFSLTCDTFRDAQPHLEQTSSEAAKFSFRSSKPASSLSLPASSGATSDGRITTLAATARFFPAAIIAHGRGRRRIVILDERRRHLHRHPSESTEALLLHELSYDEAHAPPLPRRESPPRQVSASRRGNRNGRLGSQHVQSPGPRHAHRLATFCRNSRAASQDSVSHFSMRHATAVPREFPISKQRRIKNMQANVRKKKVEGRRSRATGVVGQPSSNARPIIPGLNLAELPPRAFLRQDLRGSGLLDISTRRFPNPLAGLVVKGLDPSLGLRLRFFSALDSSVGRSRRTRIFAVPAIPSSAIPQSPMGSRRPLLIPEVNAAPSGRHPPPAEDRGSAPVSSSPIPISSTAGLVLVLKPLADAFGLEKIFVVTLQAISGAAIRCSGPGHPVQTSSPSSAAKKKKWKPTAKASRQVGCRAR